MLKKHHEKHAEKHVEPVEPVVPAQEPPTLEEMADALRGMVSSAVESGGRDRPEVVHAAAVLAKIEKPAA